MRVSAGLIIASALLLLACVGGRAEAGTIEVINAGRGGHNSRNLLARLDRDVLAHRPTLVVLMVGSNDVLNHRNAVPLKEYRANLLKLIKAIRAARSRVLVMTIPPCHEPYLLERHPARFYQPDGPNGRVRKANRIVRDVAKATRTPLVEVFGLFEAKGNIGEATESWVRNPANSRARDGVHPTAEGYRAMAEAIFAAIRKHRLPGERIVCLGDSITYSAGVKGAGTAEGETYPACLARLLAKDHDASKKGAKCRTPDIGTLVSDTFWCPGTRLRGYPPAGIETCGRSLFPPAGFNTCGRVSSTAPGPREAERLATK